MPILSLSNITKCYGGKPVLDGLSMQLQPGEKAGLIGPNGCGKTTLLRIIIGELEVDSGSLHLSRDTVTGYLPQEPGLPERGTLRHYLEKPLCSLLETKREIADLERKIALCSRENEELLNRLLHRYAILTTRFEEQDGYLINKRVEMVAFGLGFRMEDLDRELATFSGGEKTRAGLAALLLQQQDLLLLDEPTNFLDLEGIEWLERFLRESTRALIVVSHDRFFLDRIVGRIFALQEGFLKSYGGNYTSYLAQREQEDDALKRAYSRRQVLLVREERLIRESKIDERSKRQARSRRKRLDKMEVVERPVENKTFRLNLDYSGRSGREVIVFDGVSKSFGNRILFEDLSFTINRGDRVALVGPNGVGKSTLLKLIAAEETPDSGMVRLGEAVSVTYFSQEQEQLRPERTLIAEIIASSDINLQQARHHLGSYLFRGDDVYKKVKDLSGGEKCRLALARLVLRGGNCLILDEPTGHLDLPALEELEKALHGYPGTLVAVSHDRYFLQNLVNRVMELGPGHFKIYNGDFQYYLERRESRENLPARGEAGEDSEEDLKKLRISEHRRRREHRRRERRLQEEQARLEEQIALVEASVARQEKTLACPEHCGNYTRLMELHRELEREKEKLTDCLARWEEISLQLEQILEADDGR